MLSDDSPALLSYEEAEGLEEQPPSTPGATRAAYESDGHVTPEKYRDFSLNFFSRRAIFPKISSRSQAREIFETIWRNMGLG